MRGLRQGTDVIDLTEDFFRSYWNCERPARLYKSNIRKFVHSVRPFFPACYSGHDNATLYVNNDKADEVEKYYKLRYSSDSSTALKLQTKYPKLKRETVNSPPAPHELNEKLIAEEVRESIIKYTEIENIISQK